MMTTGGSLFGGLVGLVIVVAALALVAGVAISGSDVLNPNISNAVAQEKNQATNSKAQKDTIDLDAYRAEKTAQMEKTALDLENYKTIQAIQVKAEQEKSRLEVESRQRELDLALARQQTQAESDLVLDRLTRYVVLAVGTLALLTVSVGVAIFLIQYGRSRRLLALAQATESNPWRNPVWLAEQIRGARTIERVERQAVLTWRAAARRPIVGGNGKTSQANKSAGVAERRAA